MSNETIPLNLFKANLELQLRLQRLMQENGQQLSLIHILDDGLRPLFQPERNFVVPTLHQLWSSGAFGQKQPVDRHRGRGAEGRVQAVSYTHLTQAPLYRNG